MADMDNSKRELAKNYEPASVEEKWYKVWKERGVFHAEPNSVKKPDLQGVLNAGCATVKSLG